MNAPTKFLICPVCNNDNFYELDDIHKCKNCEKEYIIRNNIPLMYLPNDWNDSKYDITEAVKQFYEETRLK